MNLKFNKNLKGIFCRIYNNVEFILIFFFVTLLVLDVLVGILARHIHFNVVFSNELGKYLFIWLCAIGIAAAAKDKKHIRMTFFVERIPVRPKITWIISQILFLSCTLFFFYWSLHLTMMQFEMQKSAMGFHFPMYIFTAALPIGFGLTTMRILEDILLKINFKDQTNPWDATIPEETEL